MTKRFFFVLIILITLAFPPWDHAYVFVDSHGFVQKIKYRHYFSHYFIFTARKGLDDRINSVSRLFPKADTGIKIEDRFFINEWILYLELIVISISFYLKSIFSCLHSLKTKWTLRGTHFVVLFM